MPRDPEFDKLMYGEAGKPKPSIRQDVSEEGGWTQFGRGLGQAVLNIPETPIYYGEKLTGMKVPFIPYAARNWARQYRNRAESTPFGIAGEAAGTLASGLGEMAVAARALPALARAGPLLRGGLGAWQGIMSRPAGSKEEAIAQGVTGGTAGAVGSAVQHTIPPSVMAWLSRAPHSLIDLALRAAGASPGAAATVAGASAAEPER